MEYTELWENLREREEKKKRIEIKWILHAHSTEQYSFSTFGLFGSHLLAV